MKTVTTCTVKVHGKQDNTEEVMVQTGSFVHRVVHTTKKHPQVGWINYEGQRQNVCIAFYNDDPVWELVDGDDDPEYLYCMEKTMPIEDDPDYCGEEEDNESFL